MRLKKQMLFNTQYTYVWVGSNQAGAQVKGKVLANDRLSAKLKLHNEGIIATKITRIPNFSFLNRRKKILPQELNTFYLQLATLLSAGISLLQALSGIIEGIQNGVLKELILSLKLDISDGNTLSASMRKHPKYFDSFVCELIAIGEKSASLDVVIKDIANYKTQVQALKRKIKRALTYPMIMLIISFLVTLAIVIFIIPKFESLYNNFEANLPLLTEIIIHISRKFIQFGWLWLTIGVITTLIVRQFYKRSDTLKLYAHNLCLKIPIMGAIIKNGILARFANSLAITLVAGLPITKAIQCSQGVIRHAVYTKACESILEQILLGRAIHVALQKVGLFPALFVQMVKIGEESGTLDKMLIQIFHYYEQQLNHIINIVTELLEPLMTVMLGLCIGILVIAMYLPIFKMGHLF